MESSGCEMCGREFLPYENPVRFHDPRRNTSIDICRPCDDWLLAEGQGAWWVCDVIYVQRLKKFYEYRKSLL